jgi:hypothetical protein
MIVDQFLISRRSRGATCRASTGDAVESHLRLASAEDYPFGRAVSQFKRRGEARSHRMSDRPVLKRMTMAGEKIRSKDGKVEMKKITRDGSTSKLGGG